MTNETGFGSSFPVDPRAWWDANGDYAEKAYRTWLDAAGEMQSNAIEFLNPAWRETRPR